MSYEIKYTDRWTNQERIHRHNGSDASAKGWAESLARENNCKSVCNHIADGSYDYSGNVTHLASYGDNKPI